MAIPVEVLVVALVEAVGDFDVELDDDDDGIGGTLTGGSTGAITMFLSLLPDSISAGAGADPADVGLFNNGLG